MASLLSDIREGMKVLDASGKEIGTVDWVHLSDEDPETARADTVTPGTPADRHQETLVDVLLEAFRTDQVPEVLRNRLLREGFLRIDANGLFAADRYVLPHQIGSVADGQVMLNVTKDDLIRQE